MRRDFDKKQRGLFITVEGSDGSGKSTQVENIKKYCEERGHDAVFTREPGGTAIGEEIRKIILDRSNSEMTDLTEAYLYAAARAQHVEEKIIPTLESGKIVICDRYLDSSMAYQGSGRNLGDKVALINSFAVEDAEPDYTLFFDLPPEKGRERIKNGNMSFDRMEALDDDFHRKVYEGYMQLIENDCKGRFMRIDASQSIEEVADEVRRTLDKIFSGVTSENGIK